MISFWMVTAALGAPTLADQVALHLRLDGRGVDQRGLERGYDALCQAGRELACRWRAWDDWGRARRPELGRLASTFCARDDHEACLVEAWATGLSDALAFEDPTAAGPVLERLEGACADGVPRACSELGVVLVEDWLVDPDPARAAALHRSACDAGVTVAVLEGWRSRRGARARSPGAARSPPAACAAGVLAGCVAELADASLPPAGRIALLERACHLDDAHCVALAAARRTDRGPPPPSDHAVGFWFHDSDVLLRWAGPMFADHSLVALDALDRIEVRVAEGDREQVVLVWPDAREVTLPTGDCGSVLRAVTGVAAAGSWVHAVAREGRPSQSVCVDRVGLAERPSYLSGTLASTPRNPSDAGTTTNWVMRLGGASRGLFACGEAVARSSGKVLEPVHLDVVQRGDRFAKASVARSSGDDGFDDCAVQWVTSTALDSVDVAVKGTVEAYLAW